MNKFLLVFLIITFVGCSSTPKATQYPTRYIDQPYTLPSKVDVWGIMGMYKAGETTGWHGDTIYPVPIPLYWEHSFGDNFTLLIPIIPLGFRWKIASGDTSEFGVTASWSYLTKDKTNVLPDTEFFYKKIM